MRFTKHSKRLHEYGHLDLASMIDVVFLLLIFFVTTTTIALPESRLSPAIQTRDPNALASTADFTPQILKLEIVNQSPAYRIGGRILTDRDELVSFLEQLPKDLGVFVHVSDAVPVGFCVSAIQSCRDAGFSKVTYVPQSR